MNRKRLLGAAMLLTGLLPALTGRADETARLIARFDSTFTALDSLIFREPPRNGVFTGYGEFDGFGCGQTPAVTAGLDRALRENTDARLREWNGKTGLQLTGQAYWRPAQSFGYDEDFGESRYRGKIQAELRWYFLQSSLFGKEGRRKVAVLEEEIARAGYERERTDINDYRVKERLAQYYDSLQAGVLRHRLATLTLLDDALKHLLDGERVSGDERLRTLDDRMEAERRLGAIGRDYPAAVSLARPAGSLVTVDSAALVRHIEETQGDMKVLRLRARLIEQQEQNVNYWNRLNVAPFARYSYYSRSGLPNSSNFDIGVSFTIPLSDEPSRKKRTLRAERAVVEAEQERISRRITDKVSMTVAEIGRLNRASAGEARRVTEIREYLRARGEAYRSGLGDHNRLARAREYNMYVECLERLVDYQRRRDYLLADLQALLPDESITRYCSSEPLADAVVTESPKF